ncbi:MAG: GTP cyclohydrolase [Candidatus Methanoperedens nitroreducens]|uniref:GTP cyclohydrolase MptA n=1 Tax=Candidatus Methanoperedens nitratireducens TaxID=1392998 RepID=A0A0P8AD59_9EURY|nr:GTP cyclohydrolase MptA [Candidatus Methanoperedens sp. BLZ2]KAB2946088.1 MAG: GTP cyclohydrolase I FolE2 [Candidatus Methanoperedens sp.]KPQ42073.1 MAG: GTP cyclohydrolase [Candidatus Methanoperedens sp. BLZ1]MBZ0175030.1 GTP cyclohydrolase MptA [Candidatus Methanoperedens nitroreducens]MCX9076649.1 GTP cyclohydrolase MptA [Candidatus Methanoperedens sp.]MCX9087005.1 GTP cyclohydrolase MptA [Candidatus Methanoperedens sp.]
MKLPVVHLPDIQANQPDIAITLTRVGVTDVKKLVEVARKDKRPIVLVSTFDIFVDLPSDRKGANLSRNFEAIDEVLEEMIASPVYEIEDLCSEVAKRLIDRHEYALIAEVRMKSEYILKRETPATKLNCQEVVNIFAEAKAIRGKTLTIRKLVGAEVLGITACPCAQEIMVDKARKELKKLGVESDVVKKFLNNVPMPTHNQRGRGIISIETHDSHFVSLEKIINIIENSMSSQMFELLKRADEAMIVERAHKNPKFVEDCVRTMAQKIVNQFPELPDDSVIVVKQINEESIHRHNAFAERKSTLGELRQEINNIG